MVYVELEVGTVVKGVLAPGSGATVNVPLVKAVIIPDSPDPEPPVIVNNSPMNEPSGSLREESVRVALVPVELAVPVTLFRSGAYAGRLLIATPPSVP
jgi:hypothetical protein